MRIEVREYKELSTQKLYELLRLRAAVFVVEQDCVYQDVDDKDQKAIHVLGYKNDRLIAYARCFAPGDYFEQAAIGRVLVKEASRGLGRAHEIVKASIEAIDLNYKSSPIRISAQVYLIEFYEQHGFKTSGEKYLEDGIPHISMLR